MGNSAIGIDIGTRHVKVVAGRDRDGAFEVTGVAVSELPESAREDDPRSLGAVLASTLAEAGIRPGPAVVGLSGRDLMMRYSQVPPTPEWQLRELMEFEIQEIRSQSGEELAADFNLLAVNSEFSGDDTVLLALAKEAAVDVLQAALNQAKAKARHYTPKSVALYNVFAKAGPEARGVTMLVDIGEQNSDIAILRDSELIFARNISMGGAVFDEALSGQFNVSPGKAEKLKIEMGHAGPRDQRQGVSPQEEKVSRALEAPVGQILSMIRSSLTFCKTQLKVQDLELDRLYLCGGTAALTGLADGLADHLGIPAECFNAFEQVLAPGLEEVVAQHGLQATTALGLAMGGVYDDVYSLEVLPPAERKKREFLRSHLYSILAIVLVLGCLVIDALGARADCAKATRDVALLASRVRKLKSDKSRYESLVAQRETLAAAVSTLEAHREAVLGLPAVVRAVQKYLPPELWIYKIEVDEVVPPDMPDAEKRPAIVVVGKGRESERGSLTEIFQRFNAALTQEPGVSRTLPQAKTSSPFEFRITVYPARLAEPAGEGQEADGDGTPSGASAASVPVR